MGHFFHYHNDVKQALVDGSPVLALESTLITHGLPYPYNLEIATMLENVARENSVTPATIAILNSKIHIGLSADELEFIATHDKIVKASQRDLGYVLSNGLFAGTTVAATLFCAAQAGIKVFATGGIGGVHRGNRQDISADLTELSRNPVAVVSSGAKAILDLPHTLELLETLSIPVIGYRTTIFPAFYMATTDQILTSSVNDVASLVKLMKTHWALGMQSGLLIANPIPAESAMTWCEINPIIENALEMAKQKNITGKEITPFLLKNIANLTEGKSLKGNIALLKNNVLLGAQLAYAFATNNNHQTN